MKGLIQFVLWMLGIVVVVGGLMSFGARSLDGPVAIFAGGPFTSGELVKYEPDWSFIRAVQEVEFQSLEPARSRTTWILEHEGRIFIPSGYMNSFVGSLWKKWPIEAERDGRVILRVDGKLYPRRLVRVSHGPVIPPLLDQLSRKYMDGSPIPPEAVASGDLWIFELAPR